MFWVVSQGLCFGLYSRVCVRGYISGFDLGIAAGRVVERQVRQVGQQGGMEDREGSDEHGNERGLAESVFQLQRLGMEWEWEPALSATYFQVGPKSCSGRIPSFRALRNTMHRYLHSC